MYYINVLKNKSYFSTPILALNDFFHRKLFSRTHHTKEHMCLAIPGKIISIDKKKNQATIDYGNKTIRHANISLVNVSVGDYVLVHAGFAIQKVDPKEAKETLALFSEILSHAEE